MSTAAHETDQASATEPAQNEQKALEVAEDKRAVQIAAAQLRLVTDRRLGKQTPEWVKQLAAEKPRSRAS